MMGFSKSLSSSSSSSRINHHGQELEWWRRPSLLPLLMLVALTLSTGAFHARVFRSITPDQQQEQPTYPRPPSAPPRRQYQNEFSLLPRCEELMKRPNSPYADGAFLSRRSTDVHWRIRKDHSRELVLPNTCILKRYTPAEARTCLRDRHVMFIGDSLSRYQYLSLVYFLEYDRWPRRFNAGMSAVFCAAKDKQQQENDVDDFDAECSLLPDGYPNVCSEGDWNDIGGWPAYQQSLGGAEDGGVFRGRMESHSTRGCKNEGENMQYVTAVDSVSSGSGSLRWKGRTKLSFVAEFGWGEVGEFSPGWNYTGCAYNGTCRYTEQQYENNMKRCEEGNDLDWQYPSILEAFGGSSSSTISSNGNVGDDNNDTATSSNSAEARRTTVFQEQYADVNYAFYNRGLWGKIPEEKASQMMSLLHNFTTPRGDKYGAVGGGDEGASSSQKPMNRCFFRSTTGCSRSQGDGHDDHEYGMVRSKTFSAGCEYMDIGYLTREFASYLWAHPPPPRNVMSEYLTIFWDAVHYQPWVYEELNNLMLNVLCNAQDES